MVELVALEDAATPHESVFASIDDIVADIKNGKMVIMLDDEHRENEGDLMMAATKVRAEDVNFMVTHGRGLVCLTLTEQRCAQIDLPLMISDIEDIDASNFTVTIDAATGIASGTSVHDRARTIQSAVAADAKPEHLRRPGHVFPLLARQGGVLSRAGHTEAGCDLAKLAGFEPAAAIVEILNADGSMARRSDLEIFAKRHGLRIGTIADLIHFRQRTVA